MNSIGVAILLRTIPNIKYTDPEHRAIVVRVLYNKQPLEMVIDYPKSNAEPSGTRQTLSWVSPFLTLSLYFKPFCIDFNLNA